MYTIAVMNVKSDELRQVAEAICTTLCADGGAQKPLVGQQQLDRMHAACASGGKSLRSLLTQQTCEMGVGGPADFRDVVCDDTKLSAIIQLATPGDVAQMSAPRQQVHVDKQMQTTDSWQHPVTVVLLAVLDHRPAIHLRRSIHVPVQIDR
jgi:hypothetical protein